MDAQSVHNSLLVGAVCLRMCRPGLSSGGVTVLPVVLEGVHVGGKVSAETVQVAARTLDVVVEEYLKICSMDNYVENYFYIYPEFINETGQSR